ncbi:4Fe-4S binding protein [Archaeoglobus veneficus]|uniref:4Fe-4S ferredoxin iron-sulfur binding domain-containing protein n=1 Tax=Archaeoglobus veneficus (strain DSM 11195 / SNP6) TaxID=693661 RepID=F2KQC3_ARCVS|nr:4Fe-4S binding protein [Archaeoglobus veneficus]AEA46556.1 4Fe-4S ferredoxin iron-sulfur binding domain-containing protein [Archaeoglobus veneficus SNP6]
MPGVFRIEVPSPDFPSRVRLHLEAFGIGLREAIKPSRLTVQYPREIRKRPDNFRGMLIFEIDKCISCFQCAFVCPANAIAMKKGPDGKYYPSVNYAKCIFCHFCADTCPKGAWKSSKFMDVAFPTIEEMLLTTEKLLRPPRVERDDERTVVYELKDGNLIMKKLPPEEDIIGVEKD